MKMSEVTVKTADFHRAVEGLMIKVRVSRPVLFRVWIATKLIRVAAWLVGVGVQEEQN